MNPEGRTELKKRELEAALVAAFDGVSRPAREYIAPHECEDCARLSGELARWPWDALPDPVIEQSFSKLALLSPEALVYFLPAYLRYSLRHFTPHSIVTEFVIYSLTPGPDRDEDRWRKRLRPITKDQMEVLRTYMGLVLADPAFRQELRDSEAGWQRFEEFWADRWA